MSVWFDVVAVEADWPDAPARRRHGLTESFAVRVMSRIRYRQEMFARYCRKSRPLSRGSERLLEQRGPVHDDAEFMGRVIIDGMRKVHTTAIG